MEFIGRTTRGVSSAMLVDDVQTINETKVCVGLGCDRGTSLETLEAALRLAMDSIADISPAIVELATIDKKNDESGLLLLAKKLGLNLCFYSARQLSQIEVPSPSEVVRKYMGTPAVAEAAALLSAQTTMKNLLLEKFKYKGADGKNATVSIARCVAGGAA